LTKHSGRQFGADPIIPGKHEQTGKSPFTRHSEFDPHGDGMQGFTGRGAGVGSALTGEHPVNGSPKEKIKLNYYYIYLIKFNQRKATKRQIFTKRIIIFLIIVHGK
jgi:hypothetical protein